MDSLIHQQKYQLFLILIYCQKEEKVCKCEIVIRLKGINHDWIISSTALAGQTTQYTLVPRAVGYSSFTFQNLTFQTNDNTGNQFTVGGRIVVE